MPVSESQYHTTPNGGVRSEVFYKDVEGNLVDKSVATNAEIVEYAADGSVVGRTYGTFEQG